MTLTSTAIDCLSLQTFVLAVGHAFYKYSIYSKFFLSVLEEKAIAG